MTVDSEARLVFNDYASSEGVMDLDGMSRFCKDLGIEPTQPEIIVFCYDCQAKMMGFLTQEEFLRGCTNQEHRIRSISDLATCVKHWKARLKDFEVYKYLFDFALEPDQKRLPLSIALEYWKMLLPLKKLSLTDDFLKFCEDRLEATTTEPLINKDVWLNTFKFLVKHAPEAIANYNPDESAYPLFIDDFADWYKKQPVHAPLATH